MSRERFASLHRTAPRPLSLQPALARCTLALFALALAGCGRKQITASDIPSALGAPAAVVAAEASVRRTLGEPVHLTGEIGPGARWSIDVPENWNGDLVLYMHGYTDPVAPVALPAFGATRDALLARGFAVAASSYSENGYAVKEGLAQTHQLKGLFVSRVARPGRTYLFGRSLGGLIGLLLSQKHPGQYDGSLLVSGVVGGTDDEVQYLGDIRVLFDAVYPNVLPGGLENPPVVTNLNTQVIQPVVAAITANPQGVGIIQSLARRPLPGNSGQEIVNSLVTVLAFTMQGGGDLTDRTHGHSFFDNAAWRYRSPALPAPLIDDINARVARHTAASDALAFLAHYGEPSGGLSMPVLTLHTTRDPVVPFFHEGLLGNVAGGPWLLQRSVDRYGHDAFSTGELMTNFESLVGWVSTGQKPAN